MFKRLFVSVVLSTAAIAHASQHCTQFSVVVQDTLKNFKQGLSPDDQKWFRDKVEKKNPSVCYVDPAPRAFLI
jgi:hypothetical protein